VAQGAMSIRGPASMTMLACGERMRRKGAYGRPSFLVSGIPLGNVIGRVGMIFFSLDASGNDAPPVIR
jgi:hypothetical protein